VMVARRTFFFDDSAAGVGVGPSWFRVIHAGRTAPAPRPRPVVDDDQRMLGAGAGSATRAVLSSGRGGYLRFVSG
jgi:hypothetical protein